MSRPFFSIITPTYNRAHFIINAINSIINQEYENWELIIVDDGSTDNTKEVIDSFTDPRIKYIYQENAERSAARNNGIKNTNGEYIIFLDSDDELVLGFLGKLHDSIRGFCHLTKMVFYNIVNEKNEILFKSLPQKDNILQYIFSKASVIPVSQVATHRSIFYEDLFDQNFSLWEDTHLYIRCLAKNPFCSTNLNGIKVHQHLDSSVIQGLNKVKLNDLKRYFAAIDNLFSNYSNLLKSKSIFKKQQQNYKDKKINMYLYQARLNNQYIIATIIGFKLIGNKFSIINVFTLLKLPIHYIISKVL